MSDGVDRNWSFYKALCRRMFCMDEDKDYYHP